MEKRAEVGVSIHRCFSSSLFKGCPFTPRTANKTVIIIIIIIGNNWSHRKNDGRIKETFGSHNRRTFSSFSTKDSCTGSMRHNIEGTAV